MKRRRIGSGGAMQAIGRDNSRYTEILELLYSMFRQSLAGTAAPVGSAQNTLVETSVLFQ